MTFHTALFGWKPLRIRFDKTDWFIRVYDGIRYLRSFGSEKYDAFCNRTRHLKSQKMVVHILFLIIMQK